MERSTLADLTRVFEVPDDRRERIGIEAEFGLVDPYSGLSLPYEGEMGAEALLQSLLAEHDKTTAMLDAGHLIGVRMPSGGEFSLEVGGAIEYSSEVYDSLTEAVSAMRQEVLAARHHADKLGIAMLCGGLLPFTRMRAIPWIPKRRIEMMRNHFEGQGPDGQWADGAIGLTLSTQVSLDYLSHDDLFAKMRLHALASPVLAALFVNSPIAEGRGTGVLSRRMQYWQRTDSVRCGIPEWMVNDRATIDDVIAWYANLSMIYRPSPHPAEENTHVRGPSVPFIELWRHGFDDGHPATLRDWRALLCQTWQQVRLRNTLELRALDGGSWDMTLPVLPSGSASLTTRRRGHMHWLCSKASPLPMSPGPTVRWRSRASAPLAGQPIARLAREFVALSQDGLKALVAAGREGPEVLEFLDPVDEIAHTGRTQAEVLLDQWHGAFAQRPERLVAAYQVPLTCLWMGLALRC
ncbi:glutamate--cysteine ligase [Glycomyces albus]